MPLVYFLVHAPWLNLVEDFFSILQREAIDHADFVNLDALATRRLAFQEYYNATADLNDCLHRLGAYEPLFVACPTD